MQSLEFLILKLTWLQCRSKFKHIISLFCYFVFLFYLVAPEHDAFASLYNQIALSPMIIWPVPKLPKVMRLNNKRSRTDAGAEFMRTVENKIIHDDEDESDGDMDGEYSGSGQAEDQQIDPIDYAKKH